MAISTYAELQTAIGEWLNRTDLSAQIPHFIQLCEHEMNRRLRCQKMIVRADALLDTQYTQLPLDYLEMKSLYLKTNPPQKLQFLSNEEMALRKHQGRGLGGGKPVYFSLVGSTIELLPAPGEAQTGEMIYYAKIPALSDSNTSNWVLANHLDLYLYGSLLQAAPYLHDDERVTVWSSLFEKGVEQLRISDDQSEFTGGVLKSRARSY